MKRLQRDLPRRMRIMWQRYARHRLTAEVAVARRRIATICGAVLLALAALVFARAADMAQHWFALLVDRWPYAPLVLTPLTFAGVVAWTIRYAPGARGSGIPQVIAAGNATSESYALRLVSIATAAKKLVMTLLMLLAGASVGREGPTVQVSAAIMVWMHRVLRVPLTPGVYIAGGAAGVAAAFNTPLAGVAFAIEELAAAYEQRIAVLVMGAVMIAGLTSLGIAGDYVYFGAIHVSLPLATTLTLAPLAGILGGLAGGMFSRTMLGMARAETGWRGFARARPVRFALLCGVVVAVLGVVTGGETWGTGYGPTRMMVEGGAVTPGFGVAKFFATLATALSGAPGGVFAPSLAVGAGLGAALRDLYPHAPAGAVIVMGMVAYFVGVVRAPFTAVIIVSETTAGRGMILPMFATALIADGISAWLCPERLYHGLSRGFAQPRDA